MSPRMGVNPRDSERNGRVAFRPMLASLARACVRHRWIVLGVWVALMIVINGIASSVGPDYRTDFALPDSEAREVQDLLEANNPERAGFSSQLVIHADQGVDDPAVQAALQSLIDFSAEQEGVAVTSPYDNPQQISQSGTIAFAQLDVTDRGFEEVTDLGNTIEEFGAAQPQVPGLQVEYGGDLFGEFELPESEILGLIAAVIILILAFGSVLAMGLPIGTALFGSRHRVGDRGHRQPRHHDARLHHGDGGDDRPRRRHRLRPVHRHPLPGRTAPRPRRRGCGRRGDGHQRAGRPVRRHH